MPKPSWSGGAGGAVSGAATGSAFGPIGTAVGGVAGFFGGLFGGGKKKKKKKVSTLDKKQQELNDTQHNAVMGKGPLADLYNYDPKAANSVFDQTIANPSWRNFQEKGAPTITGSFRNQGLQNSSYVGDALSKAGRDIQETLNGERSKYLYGEQKDTKNAKRNAVENLQNRQTFAYDQAAPSGGGGIDNILKSLTPDALEGIKDFLVNKTPGGV